MRRMEEREKQANREPGLVLLNCQCEGYISGTLAMNKPQNYLLIANLQKDH